MGFFQNPFLETLIKYKYMWYIIILLKRFFFDSCVLLTYTVALQHETDPCSPYSAPTKFGSAASGSRFDWSDADFLLQGSLSADSATKHHVHKPLAHRHRVMQTKVGKPIIMCLSK